MSEKFKDTKDIIAFELATTGLVSSLRKTDWKCFGSCIAKTYIDGSLRFRTKIDSIESPETLGKLFVLALDAPSLEEFVGP